VAPLRYLDLVVLVAALPVFLGADLPLVGYGVAAVAWLAQRGVQIVLARRARAAADARRMAGLAFGSMIARTLLMAGAIVGAGAHERKAGLAAAVLLAVLFTVYFATTLLLGPYDARRSAS
jgi:hypothetical protein